MKLQSLVLTVALPVSVIAYIVAVTGTAHAQESAVVPITDPTINFSCHEIDGIPHTVTTTSQASQEVIPIFRWSNDYYPETGEDALTRCTGASAILQDYNQKGLLNYLKAEIINGEPVVCAASAAPDENVADHSCNRPIFTFKPGEDAEPTVEILRQVLSNSSSPSQERLSVSESEMVRQQPSSSQPKPATTNAETYEGCLFCPARRGQPRNSTDGGTR